MPFGSSRENLRAKANLTRDSRTVRTCAIAITVLIVVLVCFNVLGFQSMEAFELQKASESSAQAATGDGSSSSGEGDAQAGGSEETDVSETSDAIDDGAGQDDGSSSAVASSIQVHVAGAVAYPGVYVLREGDRVHDAVEAAGGLAEDADSDKVNLARVVSDGEQVYIPHMGETVTDASSSGTSSSGASTSSVSGTTSGTTAKVNINTATLEELETLPGVGEATAQAIIQERTDNGPFVSTEDIQRVSGIGEKKYAKLKDYICV